MLLQKCGGGGGTHFKLSFLHADLREKFGATKNPPPTTDTTGLTPFID